jgi:hypothetical protein
MKWLPRSVWFAVCLFFAPTVLGQGQIQRAPEGPTSRDIGQVIREREQGNWARVTEYFERFKPNAGMVNENNVAVWDAYLQLRAESYWERARKWKTRESIRADAERAAGAAAYYLNWYGNLSETLQKKLPPTPSNDPSAKITDPGRVRIGVALYGSALLELGQADEVLAKYATFKEKWFGDEAFRIWVAAAAFDHGDLPKNLTQLTQLQRLEENLRSGRFRRADAETFINRLKKSKEAWVATNKDLPIPPQWNALLELESLKKLIKP